MKWNKEFQEAFNKVKQYLETPPILVPTIPRKPLILYLTMLEESMGYVLGKQDASGKKEQAIYYLSKKFTNYEQRLGFNYTNNMAEYEACAMGITMAIKHQVKKLKFFGNSVLVIYQLREEWDMRDANEHFNKIAFHYVSQDENQMADALATLSSMLLVNKEQEMTIQARHQTKMAHCQ
ncbi:hypothetical protein CR513_20262, partial [Mucuna pruriens]